ncbi:MAG: hypothetical protein QOF14_754 [Hyphomicrobiales bacterium]|nr:hypothetical protein [Hyphomicrobiales bacterium]
MDITPKPHGEKRIIFIADSAYPPDFDFDKRPLNKRYKLYRGKDRSADIETKIHAMRLSQLRYEEKRAAKAGIPLREWLGQKAPEDPMTPQVDEFIDVCDALEALLETVPGTGVVQAPPRYADLMRRKIGLQIALKKALKSPPL